MKTQVNGVRIACQRRGKGPALMLVHGFPLDHSIWEPVARLLEDRADLFLPDLRGLGESDAPLDGYSMEQYAGDLLALLNQAHIEKAVVAGHSMGGYVALAFARLYPDRLHGLGLIATQAIADSPEARQRRAATADAVRADGVVAVADGMSPKLSAHPSHAPALHELILRQPQAGVIGALGAMAARPDSTELLKHIRVPVTVVAGTADALIPVERSREMAAALPEAKLSELEGVGHMPMMEAPEKLADLLAGLL